MSFVMVFMSVECLMNYNSIAMSGRAGRNFFKVVIGVFKRLVVTFE